MFWVIKKVDKSVDSYFNSGIFKNSLKYITENYDISPFDFYLSLGENMGDGKLSLKDKFKILHDMYGCDKRFSETLKLDYVISLRGAVPDFFENYKTKENVAAVNEFLREQGSEFLNTDLRYKDFIKFIDFEIFKFDEKQEIYLFDRRYEKIILLPDFQ